MSQQSFFCSELSRRVSEKTFGTASIGEVWLLIEYPFAWGVKALEDSNLSPAIKDYLHTILKTIPRSRVLFIKKMPLCRETISFFVVRSCGNRPSIVKFELDDYKQLIDLDIAAVATGKTLAGGKRVETPLYLVCTHGKHDKCCAKFGIPLFKSLREYAGECVWQSSHVGGDRFAANMVCFPHGLFYGHVTEEAGRRIIDEYREGRLVLTKYRGRTCYSNAVQAAEFFTRTESGLTGLNDLHPVRLEKESDNAWRVRFSTPEKEAVYEVAVSCRVSEFVSYVTCHAKEEKHVSQFHLDGYKLLSNV